MHFLRTCKMPPQISPAWKYFKNLKFENKIECIICNKKLNRGYSSTKTLSSYLLTYPDEYSTAKLNDSDAASTFIIKSHFFLVSKENNEQQNAYEQLASIMIRNNWLFIGSKILIWEIFLQMYIQN